MILVVPGARLNVNEINLAVSRATRSSRSVKMSVALTNEIEHWLLLENHRIVWDSAQCVIYSMDYCKRLTLESWFTNLEQTPLN